MTLLRRLRYSTFQIDSCYVALAIAARRAKRPAWRWPWIWERW